MPGLVLLESRSKDAAALRRLGLGGLATATASAVCPSGPHSQSPLCRSRASTSPPSSGGEIYPNPHTPFPEIGEGGFRRPIGRHDLKIAYALSNRGGSIYTPDNAKKRRSLSVPSDRISPPLFLFAPYAYTSVTMGGDRSPYPGKPFLRKGLTRKPFNLRAPFLSSDCPQGKLIVH